MDIIKKVSYERYIETFSSFIKYSKEYDSQIEHLTQVINNSLKNNYSVLEIGAGTGHFIKKSLLKCKKLPGSYTGIEPSSIHIKLLEQNLEHFDFSKEFLNMQFTPNTKINKKFDFIIMSHCFYWFADNIDQYLQKSLDLLDKEGRLIIYIQSPICFSFMHSFFKKFWTKNDDLLLDHSLHCWDITDILDKNKVDYILDYLPGGLHVENIVKDGNIPNDLKEIISFILLVEYESLDLRQQQKVVDFFKLCCNDNGKGEVIFNHPVATITVTN